MNWLALFAPLLLGGAFAQAQTVSLRAETETGHTQFRMGEAIGIKLTFETTQAERWAVMVNGRDRSVLGLGRDRFLVSPDAGISDPWKYRLGEGIAYSGPGGASVTSAKPFVTHQDLNQWVRFERPGHYRVRAEFHLQSRDQQVVTVVSNDFDLDILAADSIWQAETLRSAVAALKSTPESPDSRIFELRMNAVRQISYLDTPASIQEAASLLGTMDVQTGQILETWLRATQHRDLAVTAMKQLLPNPDQPVTPGFLQTLGWLEMKQQASPTPNAYASVAEQLRHDLALFIERKTSTAKAISIKTLLDEMPSDVVPATLRAELAALFLDRPTTQQYSLLADQWKKIAGPGMIPALRHIYTNAPQTIYAASPLVTAAVERLYELDPNQTRTLLLDEMSRPYPRLPFHTLALLPDATLPALDSLFLEHLEHNGGREAEALIARYATPGILDPVKKFYAKRDTEMRSRTNTNAGNIASPACEPPLVAYFLRVDPPRGAQLLQSLLEDRSYPMGRCWMSILGETAMYNAGPEWEKIAIAALQDAPVVVKSDAVQALGRYGSPASATPIWKAFRFWHDWWKDRPTEINDENRRFEQVFLQALAHPGNRTAGSEDYAGIRELCITAGCREQVDQYRREGK